MDTTASASPAAAAPRFVHLRLHSEYSVQDGIVRLDDAVKRAAKDRMPAVALTDLANLFGMIKFYKAARSAGVKPVVGVDVWISNEADRDKPYRMLLLAADRAGYGRLCDLLTRAYLQNKHRGRAELKREWLLEPGAAGGLIALSGALGGDVGQALVSGNHALAARLAREWAGAFPDAYYLELQRAGHPQSEAQVQAACTLASELDLPVVATHPVQFMDAADYKAHEVRVCIAQGYVLADRRRPREYTDQQYFKSQAEMAELFADIPEALENSV
ncbi:MAG: PHP domain-containing protein, partial [Rhodocyclaceae bacterium]|nr:PHP domain-containing protein [Rhodocyclaceae bacterium]